MTALSAAALQEAAGVHAAPCASASQRGGGLGGEVEPAEPERRAETALAGTCVG